MPVLRKLRDYLDEHKTKYQIITHSTAYTARSGPAQHLPGRLVAKVVMVKKERDTGDAGPAASHKVNFSWLQEVLHGHATLEQEREFRFVPWV
jgi:Ala-tRNA(Pro) deacylase